MSEETKQLTLEQTRKLALPDWVQGCRPIEEGKTRNDGIGGTDISAIAGMNPWRTKFDVYLEKTGQLPARESMERMRWGNLLEPVIGREYATREQRPIMTVPVLVSEARPWHVGSPDFLVVPEPVGLDAKNVNENQKFKWGAPGTDEVPDYYLIQCIWYMALTGAQRWDIPALFGGCRLEIYTIYRNTALESALFEMAERFWNDHIAKGVMPDVQDSDTARDWLASKFPVNKTPLREATEIEIQLAEQIRVLSEDESAAEKQKEELKLILKAHIGDADGLQGPFGKIYFKKSKDGETTDWEAVARELGAKADIIKKHTTPKPGTRSFRPYWAKSKE